MAKYEFNIINKATRKASINWCMLILNRYLPARLIFVHHRKFGFIIIIIIIITLFNVGSTNIQYG